MEAVITFALMEDGVPYTRVLRVEFDVPPNEVLVDTDDALNLFSGGNVTNAEWLTA